MSNDLKIRPTPIQRNELDVAMELTQLHFKELSIEGEDHIKKVFTEYYSLIKSLEYTAFNDRKKLYEFLPEDIKKNMI